jgi:hypothetical protein
MSVVYHTQIGVSGFEPPTTHYLTEKRRSPVANSYEKLHAQPAANVDKVEQVFTGYHADNLVILDHRYLIDIVLS